MGRRDDRGVGGGQHRGERLGIASPQDGHQRTAAGGQRLDGGLGDRLPALAAMRGRMSGLHGQAPVEQQHTLVEPAGQIAMVDRGDAQIGLQLLVDVDQRLRQRPHGAVHRETEPDRMPGRGVWVLADDQHPDIGHRPAECSKHLVARG
ncbi:hypothetical protein SDC9_155117 [bioreactor metagenome]|uniref:Uncharacterized protein n=1 Tax=bioreactor metagenome TaxID=1076179 RepID=A0A645F0L5_9ZZZZ